MQRAELFARIVGFTMEGLSGLVVLGAAWQSVDVFEALGAALESKDGVALRYLAFERARELLRQGRKSLGRVNAQSLEEAFDESEMAGYGVGINYANRKTLDKLFPKLRAEAERLSTKRLSYMNARFSQNQHPDTHPNFWQNWKPVAAPSLDVEWINQGQRNNTFSVWAFFGVVALLLTTLIGVSYLALRWFSKRRARSFKRS